MPCILVAHKVIDYDFDVMYFVNGDKDFTNFLLAAHFPTAEEFTPSMDVLSVEPNV